jgi:hypothetical protein
MVKILVIAIVLMLMACSASTPSKPSTRFSDIQIVEIGSDPDSEICEGFSLNTAQIVQFFSQAEIITFKQFHDQYDYLPCFVKGKLMQHQQICDFTIRAGATAELNCNDGTQYLYACTTCDKLFIAK